MPNNMKIQLFELLRMHPFLHSNKEIPATVRNNNAKYIKESKNVQYGPTSPQHDDSLNSTTRIRSVGSGYARGKGTEISEMKLTGAQYNEEIRQNPNNKSIMENNEYYALSCATLY
jgi:hypothetical protein